MRIVLACLVMIVAGCGRGGANKVEVQGSVTYEGKRVLNGDIRFVPIEGTTGRATQAPIVDGKYALDQKGGVPVGKHLVKIRAFILEGIGAVGGGGGGDMVGAGATRSAEGGRMPVYVTEGRENYIPNRFNDQSELIETVSPDENPQTIDFDLTNKP